MWGLVVAFTVALAAGDDAPSYEIDVGDVPNAPDACPSQDLVAESLAARMPGVVARPGREPGPNVLRLGLGVTPEGATHITVTDSSGALRLERDLDTSAGAPSGAARPRPAPTDRGGACAALADTVALIVERYMRHIGYHEPPPPARVEAPPPPAPAPSAAEPTGPGFRLGVGLAARPPWNAPWRLEPELGGALRVGRLELAASVGVGLPHEQTVPGAPTSASVTWMAVPARLSVGWALDLGRLTLIPAAGAGLDVVLARSQGLGQTRRSSAVEPTLEAGLAAVVSLTRRVWIGARAFQGIDLRPEEFFVTAGSPPQSQTLFVTPRVYTRLGVDFGIHLGKIRPPP